MTNTSQERLIRLKEVQHLTGLTRSTLYLRISQGTFPKSIKLGGRCCAWAESQVNKWINQQIEESMSS